MLPRKLPITHLPTGKVPPSVIVCGDPDRATLIAGLLEEARLLSERREYRCFRGTYEGMPLAACSHGVGASGAAIAFEELVSAGARTIVRVGTCGGLQPGTKSGDLVIATGAVQNTGYGREVVPDGFPPIADLDLTQALRTSATGAGVAVSVGLVITRDSFYQGVNPPGSPDYQRLSKLGVQAVEMECAALFLVGALRQISTGAILVVDGNVLESGGESMETYDPGQDVVRDSVDKAIAIALKSLRKLHDEPGR